MEKTTPVSIQSLGYQNMADYNRFRAPMAGEQVFDANTVTQPKSEVSTLSTTQGQKILNTETTQHQADLAKLGGGATGTTKETTQGKAPQGALTYDEAVAMGIDLNTAQYDQASNTFIPTISNPEHAANQRLTDQEKEIKDIFGVAMQDADLATQNYINKVMMIYGDLINQQKETNKRILDTRKTSGVRSGSRYASEVNDSILSGEEQAGIKRIQAIISKQSELIANAEQALQEKKYSMFLKMRDELKAVRKEKQDILTKLNESAIKKQEKFQEKKIQASRDAAVAGLLQQGITDPKQMLDYLNFDDEGNQLGDFTAEEITKTIKNLAPEGDLKSLTGATKNFYILKQKGMLPDDIANLPEEDQLWSYLKKEKDVTRKATTTTTEDGYLKPTIAEINKGLEILNQPGVRGPDGYVDPFVFKQMHEAWIEKNYSTKEFIKNFPPKNYINPEGNQYLPSYLQTPVKAKKSGAGA